MASEPPTSFHLFTALPMELQLIIWEFWMEHQPVIYHYLLLTPKGRCYAALDTDTGRLVNTTGKGLEPDINDDVPLDPAKCKIRFTGKVMTTTRARVIQDILYIQYCPRYRSRPHPVHTWVDFKRDVFFLLSTYRFSGQLRFLFNGIGAYLPADIKDDHWPHRIQQLAIYLHSIMDPLDDLDRDAFSQLKGLQKVFLIVRHESEIYGPMNKHLSSGLVDLDEYLKFRVPKHPITDDIKPTATKARDQLLRLFQEVNRSHITVELVVDMVYMGDASR
ncbi:hypothetical protein F5Y10DRAFT_268380 [Nemania abortiva]|nr:hypothetical protein F5Y10DRAFT_268380 [Nemania abortiva]